MSVRTSLERKRKEHAKETSRRQRQWQDMKKKAEEEAARAAIDALERRKCERARLAQYMREGRAAPKQIHIGKETLRKETGAGNENELPASEWPVKSPGECREELPAGVKERMRERHVLQAVQKNGMSSRKEEERKRPAEQKKEVRGTGLSLPSKEGAPDARSDGQEAVLKSETLTEGNSQGSQVLLVERPSHKQVFEASLPLQKGGISRAEEKSTFHEESQPGCSADEDHQTTRRVGEDRSRSESSGRPTDQSEGRAPGHRRPRWNTRVIQEYETAKMLRKRAWERDGEIRSGLGGQNIKAENGERRFGGLAQAGTRGGARKERPILAAREVPWLPHEDSNEPLSERPTNSSEGAQLQYSRGFFRKRPQPEALAVAREGSVLMTHSPPRTAEPDGRKGRGDAENERDDLQGETLVQSDLRKAESARAKTEITEAESSTAVYTIATKRATSIENYDSQQEQRTADSSRQEGPPRRLNQLDDGQQIGNDCLAHIETAGESGNGPKDRKVSASYSKARGSLGESMSALQLELAQMQAASIWATRRNTPESEEVLGESQPSSFKAEDGRANGDRDMLSGDADRSGTKGGRKEEYRQGEIGRESVKRGHLSRQGQHVDEKTGYIGGRNAANAGRVETALKTQQLPGQEQPLDKNTRFISDRDGEAESIRSREKAVNTARQSLADFLELEVEADKISSREAYLKQRALIAANERRRLMQLERKRPISAESIPECVEEEGKLSVFTHPDEAVCREGVNNHGMIRGDKQEISFDSFCKDSTAVGPASTREKLSSEVEGIARKRDKSAQEQEKMEEKGDLTARLAAEVVALRARLAAREAEIMRIRNTERPVKDNNLPRESHHNNRGRKQEAALSTINGAKSCEDNIERAHERINLQRKTEGQEVQRREVHEIRGEERQRTAGQVEDRGAEIAAARGANLAWEFVPPETRQPSAYSCPSMQVPSAKQDASRVDSLNFGSAKPECSSDVHEQRVNEAIERNGLVETRLKHATPPFIEQATQISEKTRRKSVPAEATRVLEREVSQDSLCPATDLKLGAFPPKMRASDEAPLDIPRLPQAETSSRNPLDVPPSISGRPFEKLERERKEESQLERVGKPLDVFPSTSGRLFEKLERERKEERELERGENGRPFLPRVPYALPGESGISAARVWEAFRVSRTHTPLVRPLTRNDLQTSIAYAEPVYGQPQLIESFAPTRMVVPLYDRMTSPDFVRHEATREGTSFGRPQRRALVRPKVPSELSLEEQSILASLQRLDTRLQGLPRREADVKEGSVASAPIRQPERLHTGQSKLETRSMGARARHARAAPFAPAPKVAWQKAKRSRTGITNGRDEAGYRNTRLAERQTCVSSAAQRPTAKKEGVILCVPAARSLLSS